MNKAWRAARRIIEKEYGGKKAEYLTVMEATERGWPHLHVLTTRRWIDQKFLSKIWAELTGAPIVHIERVKHTARAAGYVAKYLGKAPHKFEGCKRYYFTRGYIKGPKKTASAFDWTKAEHHTLYGDAVAVAAILCASGHRIIEGHDEYFVLERPPDPVFAPLAGAYAPIF